MNEEITFTITAMSRPAILERTLQSFKENLYDLDMNNCKFNINIDPIPGIDAKQLCEETLSVAKKYSNYVQHRITEKGNFAEAVKWVWEKVKTPYVFHLEDDWVLNESVSIYNTILPRLKPDAVHQVCLRATMRKYESRNQYYLALGPSLLKNEFCQMMVPYLIPGRNPETHMKKLCVNFNMKWSQDTSVAWPKDRFIVEDTGRHWMERQGFAKNGNEAFVDWITCPKAPSRIDLGPIEEKS